MPVDTAITPFCFCSLSNDNKDDLIVANQIYNALKTEGIFVIDFINMIKAIKNIKKNETKIIDDISFKITKSHDNKFLYKNIDFSHKNIEYNFTEKVKILNKIDFVNIFDKKKFKLLDTFGDYNLNAFNKNSDRLILIFKKLIN